MPVLETDRFALDYLDDGEGPVVVLVHSAASTNRQWRKLVEDTRHQYRFLALNMFGYGDTTPWPLASRQHMSDQVELVRSVCELVEDPVVLVGHSFGGAVAASAAMELGEKIRALVLLEANPFPLLAADHKDAWTEILALRDFIKLHGGRGEWERVAERFVAYWLGEGAWAALPPERQQQFIAALPNNLHEWEAVMEVEADAEAWRSIRVPTLLVRARQTTASIEGIYAVLQRWCPHWHYREVEEGGHMAPLTRPDLVNPLITGFLDEIR